MMPPAPDQTQEEREAVFSKWIEVIGHMVMFKPENMPTKAYEDIQFYEILKDSGLTDESPEIQKLFSGFKSKHNQDLAAFLRYYEKKKKEAAQE